MDLLPACFLRRLPNHDTTHRHSVLDGSPTLSLREVYIWSSLEKASAGDSVASRGVSSWSHGAGISALTGVC